MDTNGAFGFVRVDGFTDDIFVQGSKTQGAINGDEVLVYLTKGAKGDRKMEGEVVKIINREVNNKVGEIYYNLDEKAYRFYEQNYDVDLLENIDNKIYIQQKSWDKIYKKEMEAVKQYIAAHPELLNNLNNMLYQEVWDKYALGSVSKWEMDSLSFYNSPHELINISPIYNICNYFNLLWLVSN